ncbi:YtxH domain-containing protein [Planococcus sp. CPCC 101016]|uniref:YtxH domain-containing protein n=1 Tax=Planococcus sp. CPCC 101016 TaxID=2599617 RepID=UPI0011B8297A|nr:YtxH domain-containing protein [Planococcus sp. CPCC 101016]TWT08468.1 YtxH domain-containing protein [Planococcus sp. CPCC 101016]
MSRNKDYNSQSNFNDSQYNKDYYTQGGQYSQNSQNKGQNYQQSDYVPQSYGASNRYDDLYDYEESGGGSSFLVGILVGGIVGAAAALFLAPKSGKEFQADIKTQATTLKEKASQQSDSNDDGSGGFTQQLKEQSNKVVDKVKNMKGGNSPMDDGTASSEGEESINIHSTVQNSTDKSDSKGSDAFTSTANALKEAVEEVKEEKKSDSSSSTAGNTGSNTNSNTANASKGPNTTSSNNNSNKSSNSSNNNSNNSNNKSSSNSSSNNYNKKN